MRDTANPSGANPPGSAGTPPAGKAAPQPWTEHPVDIRVSIPLPFARYYLALVAGPERRSADRLTDERRRRRLVRFGNVLFVLAAVVIFYALLLVVALLMTRILE